jgi:3D (Asp-Asp-Asp) domain-containing protein
MKFKKIKLELINGTENIDITQLVKNVTWSGSYQQACRKLEFSLLASPYDKSIPTVKIECGYMVRLLEEDNELFRGYIQSRNLSYSGNSVEYMALDGGTYVHRNELVYNFKNQTAESIASKVCSDLGISIGNLASTGISMDKKFFGVSGYDIIMTAYTYASTKTNKKYMCTMDKGQLNIIEKGEITLELNFENGSNILDSNFSEDISNMVNKVKVYNGDEQEVKVISNSNDMESYGTFTKILKLEDGKDADAEAKKELKSIERKASITGFGDSSCKSGYGVKVKDAYTNLVGLFYIDEDVHTWENGIYKVDLTLAFENMMHEVNSETTENNSSSSSGEVQGKEVDAIFTAYYPANNSMQGGFYDAQGNKLDPSKLTCAAPKSVAFGTMVKVLNTGTDRDNLVYKVTDRGGAIVIKDGVYHFDLLMKDKKTAYAFGRRKGKAIIGQLVSSGTSSSGGGNSKLVELVKSKLGCKYVWGATGENTFDCSGLQMWCHKQIGISIPRTSLEQSRSGKSVSKSDLQAGDLVFFKTTSAPVGHVGMYVGNGQFIHAPNKSKPVKYDSLSSSYYSSRYVCARRYW